MAKTKTSKKQSKKIKKIVVLPDETGQKVRQAMIDITEYIARKERNEEKNGIELYFDVYPLAGTKETMKKEGFRWNGKKACWYAKKSTNAEVIADIIAETSMAEYEEIAERTGETITRIKEKTTKKTQAAEIINLDNLGTNAPRLHGAELARAIREDLKRRGVKGVTVRKRDITYDTGITVTVKATAEDMASIEEYKNRYTFSEFSCDAQNYHGIFDGKRWIYAAEWEQMTEAEKLGAYDQHINYYLRKSPDFNKYHQERKNYPTIKKAFYDKICAVFKIANQWNYDNSDSMTDYFDVGYYLDIDIKMPADFEPCEKMTEEDKKAYSAEIEAEEKAAAERLAQLEREREEAEKASREAEARRKADEKKVMDGCKVEDLSESEKFVITNIRGGIGKEYNLAELDESIQEHLPKFEKAVIARKITFDSKEAFEAFGRCLLCDFEFLKGKGGTGSDDVRLDGVTDFWRMNTEQRESVEWYNVDCVAVYCGDKLELVINPEGYSYARYTFRVTEASEILSATKESERVKAESKKKLPFYFPEDVEKQAENLEIGQNVTVYQTDGWNLTNVYGGTGTITDIKKGNYAQYEGIYIKLRNGNKQQDVFIRNGKKTLIYKGIKAPLPDTLTGEDISDNMRRLFNADEILPRVITYYNEKPLLDTVQR